METIQQVVCFSELRSGSSNGAAKMVTKLSSRCSLKFPNLKRLNKNRVYFNRRVNNSFLATDHAKLSNLFLTECKKRIFPILCNQHDTKYTLDDRLPQMNGYSSGCIQEDKRLECRLTQGISNNSCPAAKCGSLFIGNNSLSACETSTALMLATMQETTVEITLLYLLRKPRRTSFIAKPPTSVLSSLPLSLLLILICAMADSFIDPIVDKFFKACSVYLKDQYRWHRGMKDELERLRENHPMIRAVVSAYTRAQIRDRYPELNSWIWKVRDAIDEADDVLDDFEYEKLEEQLTRNKKQQKVVKKIGKRALKIDPNLKRLEKVVKKLDKVSAEVSTFLPFLENAKQEQQEQELQLCQDRETGCLPKNVLIGRGEEKDFVMQWLRKPTNQDPTHIASPTLYKNISLLSIVGHGGMGKTTLLQYIYEDLKEEFELKMWVCVSNHFDAKKVIADLLECLNKERPHLESPLVVVQERLIPKASRSM